MGLGRKSRGDVVSNLGHPGSQGLGGDLESYSDGSHYGFWLEAAAALVEVDGRVQRVETFSRQSKVQA